MLNPNQDRLDYGQVLTPPVGFQLDFAVGTTYSLEDCYQFWDYEGLTFVQSKVATCHHEQNCLIFQVKVLLAAGDTSKFKRLSPPQTEQAL